MTTQKTEFSTTYQFRLFGRWDFLIAVIDNKKMADFGEENPEEVENEHE